MFPPIAPVLIYINSSTADFIQMTLNWFLNVYFTFSWLCCWGVWILLWPKVHSDIQLVNASRWGGMSEATCFGEVTTVAGKRLSECQITSKGGILNYQKCCFIRNQLSVSGNTGLHVFSVPPLPLVVRGLFKMFLGDRRGTVNDLTLANWTKGLWRMRGAVNSLVSPLKRLFVLVALLFSSGPFTTFPSLAPCETRQLHFLLKCLTGSHLAFKVSRPII